MDNYGASRSLLQEENNPPTNYTSINTEQSLMNGRGSTSIEKFRVQGLVDMALLISNISLFRMQYFALDEAQKAISEGKVVENVMVMKLILVMIGVAIGLHICLGFVMFIQREINTRQQSMSANICESFWLKFFINFSYFVIVVIYVVINILIQ